MADSSSIWGIPASIGFIWNHRFFADRIKFLRREARVLAISSTSIIGFDYNDKLKERTDFTKLQSIQCGKKPNELVLRPTEGDAITYHCDARDTLAAHVMHGYDVAMNNRGASFRVERVGRDENIPAMLWITSSIITRTDASGTTTLSQKLLTDVEYIVQPFEQSEFLIKFKNSSAHAHRYSSPARGQIVELLIATLHMNFNITVGLRQCVSLEDAISAHIFTPDQSHYLFVTKVKKYHQIHEARDCIFGLTRTHVVIQDGKHHKIWSSREISAITALVVQQDQFFIQYHHLHYTRLSSLDKDIILANLLGIVKESGHFLEVLCREPAPGLQVLPFPRDEEQKMDDYFVQKLLNVTENNSESSKFREGIQVIQEYNANIPIIGPVIKEKRVILCIFGWLQFAWSSLWEARPESRNSMMEEVLDLLGTLTRIFSSSRVALEEATNAKALKPLLLIVLKSGFFKLNYGVCALVQSMISHHDPRANKQATINRNFVFTNDVLEEIMNLLSKSVSKFTNTLATYLFTNLLECCLYTQLHSTDWQLAKILATLLLKNLHVLFELCRSPCRAVAKNLTILIEFVLQEAKAEPAVFKNLQDECRNHCALIWQIYLAVSTPPSHRTLRVSSSTAPLSSMSSSMSSLSHDEPPINIGGPKGAHMTHMKPLFARVAGAMVEGNQDSLDLITSDASITILIRKSVHLRVAALMVEGNTRSNDLVWKMFPLHLFPSESEHISDKFHAKEDKKHKVTCHPGEPAWYQFFDRVHQDFEEPTLVWNAAARAELCNTIVSSVESFTEWKTTYSTSKHVWNYEEFNVKYKCLDEQLKVGKYYVNTVLTLGNKCHLAQPEIFVDMVIHKLLMVHHPASHQVAYLRAITWCYTKYHTSISSFLLRIENMLVLLESQPQAVVDHVLLFFEEIFLVKKNIREFVKYGGVEKVLILLQNTTNRCMKVTEDELGIYTRLSTISNILTRTLSTISPVDVSGTAKYPIPQTKGVMSGPEHLEVLTNVIASLCDKPADGTRDYVLEGFTSLLERLMAHNDLVAAHIYKTGLIYFLLCFDGPLFLSNSKLLQKIHTKQVLYSNGNILQDYLPGPMIELLNEEPTTFADVFTHSSASPILVWNQEMREYMRKQILAEIGPFLALLKTEGGTTRYTFNPIKIEYPNIANLFVIRKYYVNNLVDEHYWASWQIPNREEFFAHVCSYMQNISTIPPRHRFYLMKLIRQQYAKVANPLSFSHYPSLVEWMELFIFQEVMPNLGQSRADVKSELHDDTERLRIICTFRGHVETICEVVKLLEVTSRLPSNMDLFMACNGKKVLFHCLKCLLISCKYEFSFRELIMECVVLVVEWIHRFLTGAPQQILDESAIFDIAKCTVSPPVTHSICALALECVHVIVQQPANLERLCKIGIHYYLLRVIMGYIAEKRQRQMAMEEEGPLSNAAVLATRIFTILSELEFIKVSLTELITEENFLHLTARDRRLPEPLTFIAHLGCTHSAYSKWNAVSFDKLYEKVNTWIRDVGSAESPETVSNALKSASGLQVGSIYVDQFNTNPTATTIRPDFNELLVDTLKHLFEKQALSSDPLFYQHALSLATAINNSLSLEHKPRSDSLAVLVSTLIYPEASDQYTATILDILSKLLTLDEFKLALAQEVRSNKLTNVLQKVPPSRSFFLTILSKLVAEQCQDYPACIMESNILLVIFSFLFNKEEDAAYRLGSAHFLHELAKAPSSQSLFLPLLRHLFPPYLVNAFVRFEPDEIIILLDMNTVSAELIWNESTRKAVREFVASSLASGTNLLESKFVYSDLERELQVGNVYLNQYNKSPAPFTVTSPTDFLHSLFTEFSSSSSSSPPSPIILQSLQHLLVAYPNLTPEINESEAAKLISLLGDTTVQEHTDVLKQTLDISLLLAKANPQILTGKPILDHLSSIMRLPQHAEFVGDIVVELLDTLLLSSTSFCSTISKEEMIARVKEVSLHVTSDSQKERLLANLQLQLSSLQSEEVHLVQNGKVNENNLNNGSSLQSDSEKEKRGDEERGRDNQKEEGEVEVAEGGGSETKRDQLQQQNEVMDREQDEEQRNEQETEEDSEGEGEGEGGEEKEREEKENEESKAQLYIA